MATTYGSVMWDKALGKSSASVKMAAITVGLGTKALSTDRNSTTPSTEPAAPTPLSPHLFGTTHMAAESSREIPSPAALSIEAATFPSSPENTFSLTTSPATSGRSNAPPLPAIPMSNASRVKEASRALALIRPMATSSSRISADRFGAWFHATSIRLFPTL